MPTLNILLPASSVTSLRGNDVHHKTAKRPFFSVKIDVSVSRPLHTIKLRPRGQSATCGCQDAGIFQRTDPLRMHPNQRTHLECIPVVLWAAGRLLSNWGMRRRGGGVHESRPAVLFSACCSWRCCLRGACCSCAGRWWRVLHAQALAEHRSGIHLGRF